MADGALGLWAAIAELGWTCREQRCWNHKLTNVLDALPKKEYLLAGDAERAEAIAEAALVRSEGYVNAEAFLDRALARTHRGRLGAVRDDVSGDLSSFRAQRFSVVASAGHARRLRPAPLAMPGRHQGRSPST